VEAAGYSLMSLEKSPEKARTGAFEITSGILFFQSYPSANSSKRIANQQTLHVVATRKCRINCNETLSPPVD
jgi:hypothetical protein